MHYTSDIIAQSGNVNEGNNPCLAARPPARPPAVYVTIIYPAATPVAPLYPFHPHDSTYVIEKRVVRESVWPPCSPMQPSC